MDPSIAAEQLIAAEIAELVGTDPEHEPNEARLLGGVADFRFSVEALGAGQRHILVEVKSLHDHAGHSRPWLIDYELRHPDVPKEWSARDEWSAAGEQRIRRLGMLPEDLTSLDALIDLTSLDRLRGIAERGGHMYSLAADATQVAIMLLHGSTATLNPDLRWPAKAVTRPFPGLVTGPLDPLAVAFYAANEGRRGVADDIRLSLRRKFVGYSGTDACLAVVVSDTDFEGSWAALLDGKLGYPIDGGPPVMHIKEPFEIPRLVLGVRSVEAGGTHRWSRMAGGMIEVADGFEAVCRTALAVKPGTP
jgi:hypothetical protein